MIVEKSGDHQLRLVGSLSNYPIMYKVLQISGGAGFLPSTVPQNPSIFSQNKLSAASREILFSLKTRRI